MKPLRMIEDYCRTDVEITQQTRAALIEAMLPAPWENPIEGWWRRVWPNGEIAASVTSYSGWIICDQYGDTIAEGVECSHAGIVAADQALEQWVHA